MKRGLSLALAAALMISISSCGTGSKDSRIGTAITNQKGDSADSIKGALNGAVNGFVAQDSIAMDGGYNNSFSMAPAAGAPATGEIIDDGYVDWNTEEYDYEEENRFMSVKTSPLSTFGADVDTASYSNVRGMIENSYESIPTGAVRIEEFVNYFKYDYDYPKTGEPFAVSSEIIDCPWNEDTLLLRVGVQTPEIDMDDAPDSNLVFLIDVSGSMFSDNCLPLVQRSLKLLVDELGSKDRISIVTYASGDRVVLEGESGSNHEEIMEAIDSLEAGGSTNGSAGIKRAYEIARDNFIKGGNNRVLLCTDGDLNVGITSESELVDLIEEEKESGVFLSTLGFGYGNYSDSNMEALADHGNGNYNFIDSILEANKVLVEEMGGTLLTVAKDAKFQVEFNPSYIKGYRQLGYENRQMAAEDFADDTKDGGEIGAGQQVTVLYEIVPVDSDFDIPGVDLKYQNNEATGESSEWLTVSVRYKEPDGDKSKLLEYTVDESNKTSEPSDTTKFAVCVAEFAMLLKDSEYNGDSTYKALLNRLDDVDLDDDYKLEFKKLVKEAKALYD